MLSAYTSLSFDLLPKYSVYIKSLDSQLKAQRKGTFKNIFGTLNIIFVVCMGF